MKKFIIPLLISAAAISFAISNNSNNKPNNMIENTTETTSVYYILKDYKGRLALFINDNAIPKETYEIFTDSLPTEDAKRLKEGVKASTESELQTMLEDYIS
ncbi:MAG: hypothetical protein E7557_00940 [Ruminococcaceae bacterium]|nr:hypothetical protein [Oscillospiraceae bacterium]